jgi:lipopolysaccharide biosynthesis glycosyltransferase
MLPALHVAAKSVLQHFTGIPRFSVLSDELGSADIDHLHKTLFDTGKEYGLNLLKVDTMPLKDFPDLEGKRSTYLRLMIPDLISDDWCLYLDSDILCRIDVSMLGKLELAGRALALAPETPMHESPDRKLIAELGTNATGFYYNAGVCLMDCALWRDENLTRKCFDYIAKKKPNYHDQSAINFICHKRIAPLGEKFNFHTNVRANWPLLRKPNSGSGCLLHFVDYPKPWSAMGRWVHPLGQQWWGEYRKTAHFQKNCHKPAPMRWDAKTRLGYRKALKDKMLFSLYARGVFLPKGVPRS